MSAVPMPTPQNSPRRYVHKHTDGIIRVTDVGTGRIVTVVQATSFHFEDYREAELFIAAVSQ